MSSSDASEITGLGLEQVVGEIPAAVFVIEAPSGRIAYANPGGKEMTERLGRAIPDELTADWEIYRPDGEPYLMEEWPLVRSITSGETVVDEEYFNVLPDGSRMIVRCSSSPIYDDEGQLVAGVLVMNDVSDDRAREERLTYLAGLLDNTEDAIVALDSEWYVTVWNKGAERMYGWTAEEVLGRHTLEVAKLDISDAERAEFRLAATEHGRARAEVVVNRKDGTTIPVELITVALRDTRGEVTGFLGIHRDITERKRAEQALREAQRQSETMLESITDAFVAVDRDWCYTYVNERGLDRLRAWKGQELTLEAILGKSMWTLFPDAIGTEVEVRLREAMNAPGPVEFELYFPPTDEWVEARAHPSPAGLAIYYRSITARKRAEQERDRSARRQELVSRLGLRALAGEELGTVMDEAVALVASALDVELAGIAEILPGEGELLLRAGVGWREGAVGKESPAGHGSLMDHTIITGEPVISADVTADDRFRISALLSEHDPVSAAAVVIAGHDEPFGALGAFSKQRRSFSADDLNFLQSVANVVSTAVAREGSQEGVIQVRERERQRIARDLHDEALQNLTHALAEATRAGPGVAEPEAAKRLARLAPLLQRAGQQLRGAIYDLRLGGEEDRPFAELLAALVEVNRELAVDCEIRLDGAEAVPTGPLGRMGTEILRIVGEALVNARRHSGARLIHVDARVAGEQLCIEVADDGRGFDPQAMPAGRSGIKGMHERTALIDGRLDIHSEAGSGTSVRLEVYPGGGRDRRDRDVRVLLVEDHTAVREAIAAMFEREPGFQVVGQAASLAEARGLLEEVDVAVVDLGLPDGYGGDLIRELRDVNPRAQALVLSAGLDRSEIARAIQSGAAGAVNKTARLAEVVDSVRRLRAGEMLLPLEEVVELLRYAGQQREQEHTDRQAIERLTRREREVLQLLAEGLDSQAIADRLHITLRTERNHIANILTKLGVHAQLQAVVFALRYDVVTIRRGTAPRRPPPSRGRP
jgi:PAS domain S-box-containing protein